MTNPSVENFIDAMSYDRSLWLRGESLPVLFNEDPFIQLNELLAMFLGAQFQLDDSSVEPQEASEL